MSFVLPTINNGNDNTTTPSTVKRLSANPSLDADLHLNPPGGMLSGTNRATAFGGWFFFRDLFVRTRGKGYKMVFEAFYSDLLDMDDLNSLSSSAASSSSSASVGSSSSSTSSSNGIFVKERGLALKSSTLFEASLLSPSVPTPCAASRIASHSFLNPFR